MDRRCRIFRHRVYKRRKFCAALSLSTHTLCLSLSQKARQTAHRYPFEMAVLYLVDATRQSVFVASSTINDRSMNGQKSISRESRVKWLSTAHTQPCLSITSARLAAAAFVWLRSLSFKSVAKRSESNGTHTPHWRNQTAPRERFSSNVLSEMDGNYKFTTPV